MTDLDRIRSGEGAKFNSSIADLERIHNLLVICNNSSIAGNINLWLGALQALDNELLTYLNDEEEETLQRVRIDSLPERMTNNTLIRKRLRAYERLLRQYRSKKKLGIVAEDDASTAALR